jgi:3',5'-cyclic AMP phosphodiesterase CpdA
MIASGLIRRWAARWIGALAFALLTLMAPADAANAAQRIVAIGDLHGDYAAWTVIARDSGLIDASGKWTGGKTVLVQLGDITDRGPDSLKIIADLRRLQVESAKAGGRVVVVLGNHEAMNLDGGGSSTFWLDGKTRNSVPGGRERSRSDALVIARRSPTKLASATPAP